MRLRHRVGRAHLAFHAREVALTLVIRAVLLDHPRGQEVRVSTPESDIQPRESSIWISTYVVDRARGRRTPPG